MSEKYIFDYESLSFVKAKFSIKNLISNLWRNFAISLIGGLALGITMFLFVKSPHLQKLEKENQLLTAKIQKINQSYDKIFADLYKIEQQDKNYRNILGMEQIPDIYREDYYGGSTKYNRLKNLTSSRTLISTYNKINYINHRLQVQQQSFGEIADIVSKKEKLINARPSIMPLKRKDLIRIGSKFGMRFHPILHIYRMHKGVDLTAHRGTPIYAPADGIVLRADAASHGYGKHIKIVHGFGYMTVYGHLSKILVQPGQFVKRGELIGLVGSTGLSTSPHLHYEVRINNKPVNPVNFFYNDLSEEEYEQIIKRAEKNQ